jgi:hypothetical protein
MLRLPILLFTLLPLTVSAQRFFFGVQGGVPAQTPLGRSDQMPFSIGPSVDIHILGGLSIESGLLYDRIGRRSDSFTFLTPENGVTGSSSVRGRALEIPVLAKYRFRGGRSGWRPFLAAGPTVRRTATTSDSFSSILSGTQLISISGLTALNQKSTRWNLDPAVGAGVDFRAGRFHLEPEIRYSYWGAGSNGPLRKNQVNFLMGFRF